MLGQTIRNKPIAHDPHVRTRYCQTHTHTLTRRSTRTHEKLHRSVRKHMPNPSHRKSRVRCELITRRCSVRPRCIDKIQIIYLHRTPVESGLGVRREVKTSPALEGVCIGDVDF